MREWFESVDTVSITLNLLQDYTRLAVPFWDVFLGFCRKPLDNQLVRL